MLPASKIGKIVTLNVSVLLHPVLLIFNIKVKLNVPVCPDGILTVKGDVGKSASFIATKPGMVEVRLYLSGIPKLNL